MTDAATVVGEPLGCSVYLAAEGFLNELVAELGDVADVQDRLVFAPGPPRPAAWAQNVWLDPVRIPVASIGEAARALRAIQRNWWPYTYQLHRRSGLIQDKLPKVSAKPLEFGQPAPTAPLGAWTLLDANTLIASARCSSPFANGEAHFVEDRQVPPNRAYLKLWETFTLIGARPRPGELCLDLGASPGGWTWVLQQLGARVVAIDKAPLDPRVAGLPGVSTLQQSAFAPLPDDFGTVDWLFSDVICYPSRLWPLVERMMEQGRARNFVCTLKFQADTDHATARRFASVPGARLLHLFHNKHELTWINLGGT